MSNNVEATDLFELLGYAPDADPNTPGALLDCTLMIPNHRAMQTPRIPGSTYYGNTAGIVAPSTSVLVDSISVTPVSDGLPQQHVAVTEVSGTLTLYAAAIGGPWADVTPLSGTLGGTQGNFEQFGNHVVFCNGSFNRFFQRPVDSTANAQFTQITYAPRMAHIVSSQRFLVAFSGVASDGGDDNGDGWQCCARDDHTSWTLSPATLCTKGRLADSHGGITGAIAYGGDVYAFKRRTAYRGRFVGPPEVWSWDEWPFRLGAVVRPRAYKRGFVFLATDDLYFFDGASLTPLMDGKLRRLYSRQADSVFDLIVDEVHDTVYIDMILGAASRVFVCHVPTRRWGVATLPNTVGYYAAPRDTSNLLERSLWSLSTDGSTRLMDGDYTAGAATARPSITLNDFGDAFADSELTGVRAKLLQSTGDSTATPMFRNRLDDALATASLVPRETDGMYEIRQNARWHRVKLEFTGATEVAGVRYDFEPRGQR